MQQSVARALLDEPRVAGKKYDRIGKRFGGAAEVAEFRSRLGDLQRRVGRCIDVRRRRVECLGLLLSRSLNVNDVVAVSGNDAFGVPAMLSP
jgi:hypothetical protein